MKRYEILDHTADIGIKAYGKDLRELFENAAYGMFEIIADTRGVNSSKSHKIDIEAPDKQELLASWLRELLFECNAHNKVFCGCSIEESSEKHVEATCHFIDTSKARDRLRHEVKAVTYHNLKVQKKKDRWEATVIFDI